jgi:hypothetical protein
MLSVNLFLFPITLITLVSPKSTLQRPPQYTNTLQPFTPFIYITLHCKYFTLINTLFSTYSAQKTSECPLQATFLPCLSSKKFMAEASLEKTLYTPHNTHLSHSALLLYHELEPASAIYATSSIISITKHTIKETLDVSPSHQAKQIPKRSKTRSSPSMGGRRGC